MLLYVSSVLDERLPRGMTDMSWYLHGQLAVVNMRQACRRIAERFVYPSQEDVRKGSQENGAAGGRVPCDVVQSHCSANTFKCNSSKVHCTDVAEQNQ